MTKIGERIRTARKAMAWSQRDLAQKCGWSDGQGEGQSRISGYERSSREPNQHDLSIMARALGVSAAWLATGQGPIDPSASLGEPAGRYGSNQRPVMTLEHLTQYYPNEEPPAQIGYRQCAAGVPVHAYYLLVTDDTMTCPTAKTSLPMGSFVLIEPAKDALTSSIVVARNTQTGFSTLKMLIKDAGTRYLKPSNPAYSAITAGAEWEIVGKATILEMDL